MDYLVYHSSNLLLEDLLIVFFLYLFWIMVCAQFVFEEVGN